MAVSARQHLCKMGSEMQQLSDRHSRNVMLIMTVPSVSPVQDRVAITMNTNMPSLSCPFAEPLPRSSGPPSCVLSKVCHTEFIDRQLACGACTNLRR